MNENEWSCPDCGVTNTFSSIQKLQHSNKCLKQEKKENKREVSTAVSRKANSHSYDCIECQKTLYLTPIEILKHKKQHL